MKRGTVDLSEGLYLPGEEGVQANRTLATIQMSSTDLSAETAWNLQMSAGGGIWAQATDGSGENVSGTITANTPVIVTIEIDNSLEYRILFASGNTGEISYIIME